MKDINPRMIPQGNKGIVPLIEGYNAFKRALADIIETVPSENPENPNRGTYIREYLQDNVSLLNALVIEDIIKTSVRNYLDEYNIDIGAIRVVADRDNNEYVVVVNVEPSDSDGENKKLEIILEVTR